MVLGRRTKVGIAAAVVAAAVGAGLFVWDHWFRIKVLPGPGPFTAELEACQRQLELNMVQVRGRYITASIWHQGTAAALRIGGAVTVTDFNNRPVRFNYECWAVNGQVVRVGTR